MPKNKASYNQREELPSNTETALSEPAKSTSKPAMENVSAGSTSILLNGGITGASQARTGWEEYLDAIERKEHVGFSYEPSQTETVTELSTPFQTEGIEAISEGMLTTPLAVSGETIGMLLLERDVDTKSSGRSWDPQEIELVNNVADRTARHIENLRLLAQAEHYRVEAENAARRLTREGWENYLRQAPSAPSSGFTYDLDQVRPLTGREDKAQDVLRADNLSDNSTAIATHPIRIREEIIGELALSDVGAENDVPSSILAAVADRLGTHLENLRLLEETERSRQQLDKRAAELETVARVSTAAATILSPQELLQSVVDLTRYSFNLYHVQVYLLNEYKDTLILRAGAGKIGYRMVSEGEIVSLDEGNAVVVRAALSRQSVIVNDATADPDFLHHPQLADALSEMAIPMVVGDQLLGVFDVLASVTDRFSDEDARTYSTLAAQVAVALRNVELYAEQMATVVRLRELDHLKSAFLANMSHELRTPMNSILGFTQVIMEGLDGLVTDTMMNDLALIEKNGRHLLTLINDILDMAKVEAGRLSLSPEPVNLKDLLNDVLETQSSLVWEKSLFLKLESEEDADLILLLDYTRMRQVFINLIGNAAKFTEKGGVTVSVEKQITKALIRIRDTGVGIPLDKLEMIFESFSQVDTTTTRKAGGTGLGLPISRRLVELHGGHLWAESTGVAGEGSTFVVELPITPLGKL